MTSDTSVVAFSGHRAIKSELKRFTPPRLWSLLRQARSRAEFIGYRVLGRPAKAGETAKAMPRRLREGWFEKYCVGRGLDIGYGGDLLCGNCIGWDREHGDAQMLAGVKKESFDFVYSSHTLEHVRDASAAIGNWYRAVKPGGYLILFVPDRDRYEKKLTLPSRWNPDHKRYFLLDRDQPPDTVGLLPLIGRVIPAALVISARNCSDGHTITDPLLHSDGEFSLEVIVRKRSGREL